MAYVLLAISPFLPLQFNLCTYLFILSFYIFPFLIPFLIRTSSISFAIIVQSNKCKVEYGHYFSAMFKHFSSSFLCIHLLDLSVLLEFLQHHLLKSFLLPVLFIKYSFSHFFGFDFSNFHVFSLLNKFFFFKYFLLSKPFF